MDTLCGSVLYGFNALGLVSPRPCRPFDARRDGLSLGEAGGFAILERAGPGNAGFKLRGYGESSDAHHVSAPHPKASARKLAMREALQRAGLEAGDIDYLNLHGTATPANDKVEALAVAPVPAVAACLLDQGLDRAHAGSAAGIVESAFALLALEHGLLPGMLGSSERPRQRPAAAPTTRSARSVRDEQFLRLRRQQICSLVFGRAA